MDNKLRVINYLGKNIGQQFTMHELSKRVNIPYATFYRTVKEMSDMLITQNMGKSTMITLNQGNQSLKSYLIISSEEERKEYLKNHPIIKKLITEIKTKDIIVLFGSYAKGTQRESSDIDLLIINRSGKKDISFSKYEILFKIKINPIFITIKEFKDMLKEKEENVGKQALKYHILLNNPQGFWGCIINERV